MPIQTNCGQCGASITRSPSHIREKNFCTKRCAYDYRRKAAPTHRRLCYLPEHPLAGKTGLLSAARVVLYEKIGGGTHPCHWCGKTVTWMKRMQKGALVADHVDNNGLNDAPDNLVAACQNCNTWRARPDHGVKDDEVFVTKGRQRLRAEIRQCRTCGEDFKFVPSLRKPGKITGRYCSLPCLWSRSRSQ